MHRHAIALVVAAFFSSSPAWASHGGKCVLQVELSCWDCSGTDLTAKVLASREVYAIGGGIACPKVGSDIEFKSDQVVPKARRGDQVEFTYDVIGGEFGESREWKFQSVVARGNGCSSVQSDPFPLLLLVALLFVRRG